MKATYLNILQIAERATGVITTGETEINDQLKIRFDGEALKVVDLLGDVILYVEATDKRKILVQKLPFEFYCDLDSDDEDYENAYEDYLLEDVLYAPDVVFIGGLCIAVEMGV